ncbi:Triosephosphate isomerase [Pisolithus marmoratus]|nr:Triosephosphate isomerase [Pisolithus marmoratus]
MPHQFFVGGNFKMKLISLEQKKIIITAVCENNSHVCVEVVIAPPSLYLLPLKEIVKNGIRVSAQNCYCKTSGAYTGEISPAQLADAGIPYVIIGHSERRTLFHETSELVAQKTKAALNGSLSVILCVGETLLEREAGQTTQVVESQLQAVVTVLKEMLTNCGHAVIAYEPVWAIGTGKVATTAQAQEVHAYIRQYLSTAVSRAVSENTRISYGGSVGLNFRSAE